MCGGSWTVHKCMKKKDFLYFVTTAESKCNVAHFLYPLTKKAWTPQHHSQMDEMYWDRTS